MTPWSTIYGSSLVVLGGWASFTTLKILVSRGGRRRHRTLVVVGGIFVAACLLPGISLLVGAFAPWMLIPLGLCYIALIPHPCYFKWANRGRIRSLRTVLFLSVGGALIVAGLGWLPLSWFGL